MYHTAMYISQAIVSTRVAIGEFSVVETHQVQYRGVKVMNMNGILGDPYSIFVRFPVCNS